MSLASVWEVLQYHLTDTLSKEVCLQFDLQASKQPHLTGCKQRWQFQFSEGQLFLAAKNLKWMSHFFKQKEKKKGPNSSSIKVGFRSMKVKYQKKEKGTDDFLSLFLIGGQI